MFEFKYLPMPVVVEEACPGCIRHWQEQGHSFVYQKLVICNSHRTYLEKLLRNPNTPREELTIWINFLRVR